MTRKSAILIMASHPARRGKKSPKTGSAPSAALARTSSARKNKPF